MLQTIKRESGTYPILPGIANLHVTRIDDANRCNVRAIFGSGIAFMEVDFRNVLYDEYVEPCAITEYSVDHIIGIVNNANAKLPVVTTFKTRLFAANVQGYSQHRNREGEFVYGERLVSITGWLLKITDEIGQSLSHIHFYHTPAYKRLGRRFNGNMSGCFSDSLYKVKIDSEEFWTCTGTLSAPTARRFADRLAYKPCNMMRLPYGNPTVDFYTCYDGHTLTPTGQRTVEVK